MFEILQGNFSVTFPNGITVTAYLNEPMTPENTSENWEFPSKCPQPSVVPNVTMSASTQDVRGAFLHNRTPIEFASFLHDAAAAYSPDSFVSGYNSDSYYNGGDFLD